MSFNMCVFFLIIWIYSNPDYGCSEDDSDSVAAYVQSLLWVIIIKKLLLIIKK